MALKKRKVDKKNINDVQGGGLQVRFVRGGYEYSEYFAYSKFGGKRKTLEAARIRRDEMILEAEGG
ncbi:MAG: hypothetical protein OEW37_00045 [Rhodospirillaceae bacterium]|nr:hypothetical protein [Rhodospirillaceae bacterium]